MPALFLTLAAATAVAALPPRAPAAPEPPVAAQAQPAPAMPVTAEGRVVDAISGEPISGVLVQQDGAVTSAFTQADGSFRLQLERSGSRSLQISGIGFETKLVAVDTGKNLLVRVQGLTGFVPASPMLPTAPLGQSAVETAPLNTGMIFAYRLRQATVQSGLANYSGLVSNDYRLGLRFRLRPLLLEAEGAHYEVPVDVNGLDKTSTAVFRPSTWQAGARVGLLAPVFHPDLELALSGGYRWTNTVPNNADVPYTGSDIDWEQTRHAVGPVATLAWRPARGRFHLEGSYGYYPWTFGSAEAPGKPFANALLSDARALVGFEVVPGMRLGLGYQDERWSGLASDQDAARMLSLQVHYTPGGMPKGME